MVNYNSYYNSSMDSKIINPNQYNLDKLLNIKLNNSSLFKTYSNILYSATRSNPKFAKDYLNRILVNSSIDASSLLFYKEIESHIYGNKPSNENKIKYRIKDIFGDHWDDYVNEFSDRMSIPEYVFENVERMINCRTLALGYSTYECNNCPN